MNERTARPPAPCAEINELRRTPGEGAGSPRRDLFFFLRPAKARRACSGARPRWRGRRLMWRVAPAAGASRRRRGVRRALCRASSTTADFGWRRPRTRAGGHAWAWHGEGAARAPALLRAATCAACGAARPACVARVGAARRVLRTFGDAGARARGDSGRAHACVARKRALLARACAVAGGDLGGVRRRSARLRRARWRARPHSWAFIRGGGARWRSGAGGRTPPGTATRAARARLR
jgi:hypothetical protein